MKTVLACLGAALLQVSLGWTPASADDLLPANYNWSGIYLGGQIGGFWSNIDGRFTNFPATFNPGPSGGIGGVVLGFQHEFGPIVLGIEGDYLDTFHDDNGSDTCHPVGNCFPGSTLQGKISRMWTVGPRLGWDAGRWMPYVTGGYANASIVNQASINFVPFEFTSNRFDGWYIGGGVDMALSGNWKLGVEYRHYEFDDKTITVTLNAGGLPAADRWALDPDADSVTARLTYVFGCESDEPAPLK
jgi:outer membrane immunogenic protein